MPRGAPKKDIKSVQTRKNINNTKEEQKEKIKCINCGCSNQSNFYVTKDKNRKFFGKIPYCKDCIKEIYNFYLKKYKEMNLALYYMCRKIDIPYIHVAYTGATESIKNPKSTIQGEDAIVQSYMKNLAFSEQNGWGYTFDDSMGEDQIDGLTSYDIYTKIKKSKKIQGDNSNDDRYEVIEYDTAYLQSKWGLFDNEELAQLESEYLDWAEKLGFKNGNITEKSIDVIVRQICYQTLDINKDRINGVDVNKKVDTLTKLMNNAGLIEKQKSNTEEFRSIGQRIEDIERFRPIKEVDPELADVDNLRDLYYAFVGCMARSLNKSNEYTKEFEKRYAKYSIDIIENPSLDIEKEVKDDGTEQNQNKEIEGS